ncbi:hypothetical protein MBLNU459_g2186t2 [Dothideomycetes sp. NU459]
MAYNGRYSGNPDALPAHAEPEQAAAMLSGHPRTSSYGSKPPPPVPVQNLRQDDRYGRPPSQGGAYSPGPQNPYHDNRAPAPRYDNYPPQQSQPPPPPQQQQQQSSRYNTSYNSGPPPPPSRNNYASPPPPASYGSAPPPTSHNRPPIPHAQRPPTVAPAPPRDGNDREALWPLFMAVDKDRSGQLSESSLRRALVNGDYTAFDVHTVRMMIRMFDTDRSGTINFDEFCGLWGFLAAWRGLFDRFDVDRSGTISFGEFQDALVAFGYRLSPQFVQLLFSTFARNVGGRGDDAGYGGAGAGGREKGLSFDLFVQACISLKRMTDVFKKYDDDRDGYITLSL